MAVTYGMPDLQNAQKAFQSVNLLWDENLNEFRVMTNADLGGVSISGLTLNSVVRISLIDASTSLYMSGVSVTCLAPNSARNFLFVQNNLSGAVSLGFDTAAVPPQSLGSTVLMSGDSVSFEGNAIFTGQLSAMPLGTVTGNLTVKYG